MTFCILWNKENGVSDWQHHMTSSPQNRDSSDSIYIYINCIYHRISTKYKQTKYWCPLRSSDQTCTAGSSTKMVCVSVSN